MKRYTTFSIVFYSPITLIQTGQTNKHKSSFNNKDYNVIDLYFPTTYSQRRKTITPEMRARLIKDHQDGVSYKRMESPFGVKIVLPFNRK